MNALKSSEGLGIPTLIEYILIEDLGEKVKNFI
jgi:hypothetical protein